MTAKTVAGQLAIETIAAFPRSPTATLARKLFHEHPAVYRSVEHARRSLRYYRGESGKGDRHCRSRDHRKRFALPASDATRYQPYRMTEQGTGLVIGDLHIPYHDRKALDTILGYAIDRKASAFCLLLGDTLDAYQLSRYCRDPRRRRFRDELVAANALLDVLCAEFKTVIWKDGNHDQRYEHYLMEHASEICDLDEIQLHQLLRLEARGIPYVDPYSTIHAGHLTLLHGHEYRGGVYSPVNPARGLYLRAKACSMCAHNHQTSNHTDPDIRQVVTSCWSIGCVCDVHPKYMPLNRWNLGFALLSLDGRQFDVENHKLISGHVY